MTISLFSAAPIPVLNSLWNVTQASQVSLASLTPAVTALRERLDEPGALGMSTAERGQVLTALQGLVQQADRHRDASGLVPRILLQPQLESIARSLPVRLNYQGGGSDDIANEYCIGEEVGSGGCSRVYHGYSLTTGVTVAIKLADAPEDGGISQEVVSDILRREYEILSRLPEGTGPRVLRFGTMQGRTCLVMEYLQGRDLYEAFGELHHELTTSEALDRLLGVAVQCVQSIAAVHSEGIVHRDIKPENFRLRPVRVSGCEVRTFDFGIAVQAGDRPEMIVGTPDYMPPESFDPNVPAGLQRDVYALGATLYWLFTGQTPFHSETMEGVIQNVRDPNFRPESVATVLLRNRPDLKGKVRYSWLALLDAVISRALSRNVEVRYQDAGQLLQALRPLMRNQSPAPSPVSRASRRAAG